MSNIILSNFPQNDNKNDFRTGPGYYIPITVFITLLLIGFFWLGYLAISIPDYLEETEELKGEPIQKIVEIEKVAAEAEPEPEKEPVIHLTDDAILAAVAMHEAGNQDVLGMAFVIMTVLNRCDYYDATVESIVTAPNQYAYPYYGKISDNAYRAIKLAREYRDTFPPIAWFQTDSYPIYGEHAFKWGDHYFCSFAESEG